MTQVAYDLTGVRQIYGERTVLNIPALTIQQGEVFALIGPSGAGKSTLLRLLALLEAPAVGVLGLHINGHQVTQTDATIDDRRQLAMVFQRPLLLDRSVAANVAYGLKLRGENSIQERVEEALACVGLREYAHAHPRSLSGGEAQRVALARALVLEPKVLLLDEPTAHLDPYNVQLIEALTREQHDRYGTTVMLATHNIFQARRMATRVALLMKGKLVEVAPTDQFFNAPQDSRTAAFVSGDLVY